MRSAPLPGNSHRHHDDYHHHHHHNYHDYHHDYHHRHTSATHRMMPPPLLSTSTTTTSITKRSNGAGGSSLAVSMKNRARKEALASHTRIRSLAIKFGHNSLSPPRSVGSPLSGTTVASFASNSNSVVSSRRSSLSFARAVTPSTTGGGATFDDALTLLSKIDFFRASQPTKSGLTRASTHNVASSSATLLSSSSAGSTVVPPSPNSRLRANKLGVMEVWKFNPERFRERSASITSEPGIVLTMIGTEGAGDNSVTAGAVHSAAAAAAAADLDNSVANKLESIDSAPEPVKLASNDGICIIEKGSESLNEATVQETINNKQILSSTDGLMITTAERSPTIVDRKSQDVSSSAITSVVSAQQPRGSAVDSALSYISVLEVESTLVILMRLTHPHALLLQKSSVADPISTSILECTGFIVEFLEFAKVSASASSLSSTSSRSPSPSPRPHKLLFRSPAVEHRMCLIQLTGRSNPMFLSQAKSMLLDYTEQIASPPLPQSPRSPRSPRSPSTAIISSPLSSPVRPRIVPNDRRDDADSGVRLYSPANAPEWAVQSHTTEMAPVIVTVDQSEMDRVFGREAAHEMMQTHRSP